MAWICKQLLNFHETWYLGVFGIGSEVSFWSFSTADTIWSTWFITNQEWIKIFFFPLCRAQEYQTWRWWEIIPFFFISLFTKISFYFLVFFMFKYIPIPPSVSKHALQSRRGNWLCIKDYIFWECYSLNVNLHHIYSASHIEIHMGHRSDSDRAFPISFAISIRIPDRLHRVTFGTCDSDRAFWFHRFPDQIPVIFKRTYVSGDCYLRALTLTIK